MPTITISPKITSLSKILKTPLVLLSLEEWQQIEEILAELSSPRLQKEIAQARAEYKRGEVIPFEEYHKKRIKKSKK